MRDCQTLTAIAIELASHVKRYDYAFDHNLPAEWQLATDAAIEELAEAFPELSREAAVELSFLLMTVPTHMERMSIEPLPAPGPDSVAEAG